MHISLLLSLLHALALALPSGLSTHFSGDPLTLANLLLVREPTANATLSFSIHDPDPLTNATALCSGAWRYGSKAWPSGSYWSCSNASIGWNMASWTSWGNFSIGVEHAFQDSSVGKPPYDHVVTFGTAVYDGGLVTCGPRGEGGEVCIQRGGSVVLAPITRVISKR
ncbi:hypothetical protein B0A48_17726 [Cryoendolithus antarcticus]|uniref:AA1-like domain-containing protein n=1 Tax=Cryoendolithus antarcticus TaxID=1507870 RepID=A0A1V8SAX8_9PEZI|nr:hypothetical protein B0A48_17726 [Cryoendolithus antarcticus]